MAEKDKVTDLEFKWGKRRGVGGKMKEVQVYESFTYDGVEYTLYDCVYMYKEGEPEPYIGKLIKIWETADKTKKVKVQWFFHPSEILSWLGDEMVLENEIFLATGEGIGLANINPLEAIAGKSNVVCISNDTRNRQPSEEELKMADYIFYRTFDVGRCTILDKMDDNVGGLEIKFIFNSKESAQASGIPKLVSDSKEGIKNVIACNGKEQFSIQNTLVEFKSWRTDGDHNQSAAAKYVKDSLAKRESLCGVKPASGSGVKSSALATTSLQQASALGQKGSRCGVDALKDDINSVTDNKVKAEERLKSVQDSDALDDRPTKKARTDNSIKSPVDESINCTQKLLVQGNDVKAMVTTATASEEKTKSGHDKDPLRQDKRVKSAKESGDFEDRPAKKAKADCSAKEKNRNNIQKVTVNSDGNHATDLVRSGTSNGERTKSILNMDSLGLKSPSMMKLDEKTRNISSVKLPKVSASGSANEYIETEGKVFEVTRRPDAAASEEKTKSGHDKDPLRQDKRVKSAKESGDFEDRPAKKAKDDCSAKEKNRNNIQKVTVNSDGNHATDLVRSGTSNGERTKSILNMDSLGLKSPSMMKLDEKTRNISSVKLPKVSASGSANEYIETEGKVFEVTRRPDAAASEEKTKSGHDKDPLRQDKRVKSAKESGDFEDRPAKKAKADCSAKEKNRNNIQKVTANSDGNHATDLVRSGTSIGERTKSILNMDSLGLKSPSMMKLDEKTRNISSVKLPKVSASGSANEYIETEGKVFEVTRRPDAAASEEKTKSGHDKDPLRQDKRVKSAKESGDFEDRPAKKAKADCSAKEKNRNNIQKVTVNSDGNHATDLVRSGTSNGERTKSILNMDSLGLKSPSMMKLDEKTRNISSVKLPKVSASGSANEYIETEGKVFEVTRRPDAADKSKWFRTLPWEERMRSAHEQGTLVLLQNLDPEYTSGEVEDIIWHVFDEFCSAKMVQRTTISSPHSGQAIVIFKTREATGRVIRKLYEECLMLPNGRPLVGSAAPPPNFPGKQPAYFGHLVIDNMNIKLQREMKDAVSTSHCSQPNTIEYDMAMEWCLLQSRSDSWWERLHKQQGQELRKHKANLKSK